eukprot:13215047-Alexandrium_andersonii.AAC.1
MARHTARDTAEEQARPRALSPEEMRGAEGVTASGAVLHGSSEGSNIATNRDGAAQSAWNDEAEQASPRALPDSGDSGGGTGRDRIAETALDGD